jgi:hypothetical protein
MKRLLIVLMLVLTGCTHHVNRSPGYEQIVNCAKEGKARENATYKISVAEMAAAHKAEQKKYDAIIAHPERYADVVDLSTGQNIPNATYSDAPQTPQVPSAPAGEQLPDIANPNTPQDFTIPAIKAVQPECKDGKCPVKGK